MQPDAQFSAIAEAIQGAGTQAERAALAYRIFGKDGVSLLNVLALGKDGLAASADEAKRLGLTFSRIDAAKVEAANDAITRVQAAVTGAGQSLAIALSHYIEAAAVKLLDLGMSGDGSAKTILNGVEWVVAGVANMADYVDFAKGAWHGMSAGAMYSIGAVVKAIQYAGNALEWLINLIPGADVKFTSFLTEYADELIRTGDDLRKQSEGEFNNFLDGKRSAAVASAFAEIRNKADDAARAVASNAAKTGQASDDMIEDLEAQAKAQEKITGTLDDLQKQLDRFGMSDVDIKIADLAELGATNEQLEQARATLEKLHAMEAQRDREANITDMLEDLDKQVRLFGLSEHEKALLDLEAMGASEDQIARAKAAMDQLNRLSATPGEQATATPGTPQLVQAGSAEAQRLAYQAARGNRVIDEIPKRQLATQEGMARSLRAIEQRGSTDGQGWDL